MPVTVDSVREFLTVEGGYQHRGGEVFVGPMSFPFEAVLTGPGGQDNLVLIEPSNVSVRMLERRIRALCVTLDNSGSARSLTLIVAGSDAPEEELQSLQGLCRVLVVPSEDLKQHLGLLLPLQIEAVLGTVQSADGALRHDLGRLAHNRLVERLIRAAQSSAEKVEEESVEIIRELLEKVKNDD
jgi:hypothetical protein